MRSCKVARRGVRKSSMDLGLKGCKQGAGTRLRRGAGGRGRGPGPQCARSGAARAGGVENLQVTAVAGDIASDAGRAALLAACPSPDILMNNAAGPPSASSRAGPRTTGLMPSKATSGRQWQSWPRCWTAWLSPMARSQPRAYGLRCGRHRFLGRPQFSVGKDLSNGHFDLITVHSTELPVSMNPLPLQAF